jgi:intein/homing endonuclease
MQEKTLFELCESNNIPLHIECDIESRSRGINVLSLFDGMSCGQLALTSPGTEFPVTSWLQGALTGQYHKGITSVNKYFACEIKPHAMQVTQENFPETVQLGDVTKVKANELPRIDLLVGGSPCFVAGTKVITKNFYKNIEDISVGDEVLTHNNIFKKVIRIGSDENKKTYMVKAQGMKPTEATGNHPYYVREMYREWDSSQKKYVRVFSEPKWKEVSDLSTGDFIGLPILNTSDNPRNLSEEDCWLIGRYLADGHYFKRKRKGRKNSYHYGVVYSIGDRKLDEFESNVSVRKYTKVNHTKSVHRYTFSSMEFVELLDSLNVGKGAINKRIPMELLNLPHNLLSKLLDGYMSGDGCYIKDIGEFSANSISEELIMTLSLAVAKVKQVNSSYHHTKRPKTHVIEGRTVNQNDSYAIKFRENMKAQSQAKVIDDIIWLPIRSVDACNESTKVYNLEVEGDNTYTANNIIVHNCQDFSQANRERKGVEGSKSGLFWEWVRLVKETRPKYFLLENVKMKKEHEKVVTDVLGVEPIKINSKLVSGQLRNRLYWTNIPDIKIPEEIDIKLQDVLTDGYTDREKSRCLLESDSRPLATPVKMFHRYYSTGFTTLVFKSEQHYLDCKEHYDTHHKGKAAKDILESDPVYEGLRYLNQTELERLQTVPEGYTKSLSRNNAACLLGDGWTVDVIRHILSYMKIECVESDLSHGITQQRYEVESEQLHASLDEFMKDLK